MKKTTFNPDSEYDLLPLSAKSGIKIKPSHKGLLHKNLGVPQGEKIPASKLTVKSTDSAAVKKRKVFAQNAKKWHKGQSGINVAGASVIDETGSVPSSLDYTPQVSPLEDLTKKGLIYHPSYENSQEQGQSSQLAKNPFDLGDTILSGLLATNMLIPGDKPQRPIVRPGKSYNPNQYGTGSQAIAQYGTKVSNSGYKANSPDRGYDSLTIPSNQITMEGVPHDVYGVDDMGYSQLMKPGRNYQFPGNSVTEIPMRAQNGATVEEAYSTRGFGNPLAPTPTANPVAESKIQIKDSKGHKTGDYPKKHIEGIIKASKLIGEDPYEALALALQESGMGTAKIKMRQGSKPAPLAMIHDFEPAQEKEVAERAKASGIDPEYLKLAVVLRDKKKYGKQLGFTDEASLLQSYNGYGTVTKKQFGGADKAYGVPIGDGINMKKNPLYGKRLIQLKGDLQSNDTIKNMISGTMQDGGTFQTQQQIEAANAQARNLASRQKLVNPENTYVAKNIGDPIPKYKDAQGNILPTDYSPVPKSQIKNYVPPYVKELEWSTESNLPYYIDQSTGDMQFTNKDNFYLPRFRKENPQQPSLMAKMQNGGLLPGLSGRFGVKMSNVMNGAKTKKSAKNGASIKYLEGETYNLDDDEIQDLLDQGYELEYQ